jgi:hypothetical protein
MADLADVENAIVAQVVGALYPNGILQSSVTGATCRVYRGWPSPAALNSDLSAGTVNVTVFPATVPDEVPDRYFDAVYADIPAIALKANVSGQSVTISGLVGSNQIVGLLIDGVPLAYSVNINDTPVGIAANIATAISGGRIAILSGSTITIPDAKSLVARIATNAMISQAMRRQRREIQVCCWCPSPLLRDQVSKSVDLVLAASSFIDLADNTKAHVHYISTQVYDLSQNALLHRRDLCYRFEYTIIDSTTAPVMLFGDLLRNGSGSFV